MKNGGVLDYKIVNIDPSGCVDIDDAFHWSEETPDMIYVHIADLRDIPENLIKFYIEAVSTTYPVSNDF